MLVSKVKPCMSQHEPVLGEAANGSLKQLQFTRSPIIIRTTAVILGQIRAQRPDFLERLHLLVTDPTHSRGARAIRGKIVEHATCVGAVSLEFLTYQLPTVGSWPTVALTGDGELGFDSGEGACETATTSKEGSRRANYPILTQGGSDKK